MALGALSIVGQAGDGRAPAAPAGEVASTGPEVAPLGSEALATPLSDVGTAAGGPIEDDPAVLASAEEILAEAAAPAREEMATPVAGAADALRVEATASPTSDEESSAVPSAGTTAEAAAADREDDAEAAAALPEVASLIVDEFPGTVAAPMLQPSVEPITDAPGLVPEADDPEVARGPAPVVIPKPAPRDSAPEGAPAGPEVVLAGTETSDRPEPEAVARLPTLPSQDVILRPEPRPDALAPLPGEGEAAPGVDAAPATARSVAGVPTETVLAAPRAAVEALPTANDPSRPTAGAEIPVAPRPEVLTLSQATPPAEPPSGLPRRIRLEGTAMPGTDAVPVRRPVPTPASASPDPASAVPDDAPATLRFAAPFAPPESPRPLLSLVLLDDGSQPEASERLVGIGAPVSVAVDPSLPDATARMETLRAAGIEVLALASLPPRPQPQDVEVFLGPALDALPEAVAVLDLGEAGLGNRDATAQMALARLAREGLGAVLIEGGVGGGVAVAEAAGVPAVGILRDLDGAGQDTAAILRQLDDAVRRAGQEGEAVLLARASPGTLQVLDAWIREGRAREVTLAPVSALLRP